MDTIVDRIRTLMSDQRLSQRELARRAGYKTESQVGNVIRSLKKNPQGAEVKTVAKIAKGLGVSPAFLLTGHEDPVTSEKRLPDEANPPDYLGLRFRDLPDWDDLLEGAMAQAPPYPPWVWRKLASTRIVVEGPINVAAVADMAEYVLKHGRRSDEPPPKPPPKKRS